MEIGVKGMLSISVKLIKAHLPFPMIFQEITYSYQPYPRPWSFYRMNDVVTNKRIRMSQGTCLKMLVFLKYKETLSGSKGTPSSSDGGSKSDESDKSDKMDKMDKSDELDRERNGDSYDAARTKSGCRGP